MQPQVGQPMDGQPQAARPWRSRAGALIAIAVLGPFLVGCGGSGTAAERAPTNGSTSPHRDASRTPGSPPASPSAAGTGHTAGGPTAVPTGLVRLTDDGGLGGTPLWGLSRPKGWRFTILDRNGLNQAKRADGCQLTTYQAKIQGSIGTTDLAGSQLMTRRYTDQVGANSVDPKVYRMRRTVMPRTLAHSLASGLEFVQARIDYTRNDNHQRWASVVDTRALIHDGAVLQVILSCPVGRIGSPNAAVALIQSMVTVLVE